MAIEHPPAGPTRREPGAAAPRGALPLDGDAQTLAPLRAALRALRAHHPEAFKALFDPTVGALDRVTAACPDELAATLTAGGLTAPAPGGLRGLHRLRCVGDHVYAMEVGGGGSEYLQDLWPETDELLTALPRLPPGRLCDLGTGTGVLAVEAAALGHDVTGTDLFPTALALARFNHALNGAPGRLDLRAGHLLHAVAYQRFNAIVSAPHYSLVNDQLRLELLRAAPFHLAHGGVMLVATPLEWEGEDGPVAAVEVILRPLAARGFDVTVTPIEATLKRHWFTIARSDPQIPGLVSRHRFLVRVQRRSAVTLMAAAPPVSPGRVEVIRATVAADLVQEYAPLSVLTRPGPRRAGQGPSTAGPRLRLATVTSTADLVALRLLLEGLRSGIVRTPGGLAGGLLDACRFGALSCVGSDPAASAAGAILDAQGGVRPCAHGGVIAGAAQAMHELVQIRARLADEAATRRGCPTCPATATCSRCLFPAVLEERDYCDLIRRHYLELPHLPRLFATLREVPGASSAGALSIKVRRAGPLVAARGRPRLMAPPHGDDRERGLGAWLRTRGMWIATVDDRFALTFAGSAPSAPPRAEGFVVDRLVAEIAELLADGSTTAELIAYAQDHGIPSELVASARLHVVEIAGGGPDGPHLS